jgi:hypothetical protein
MVPSGQTDFESDSPVANLAITAAHNLNGLPMPLTLRLQSGGLLPAHALLGGEAGSGCQLVEPARLGV